MYYETVTHERRLVASAEEAARVIHEGTDLYDYQALSWTAPNGRKMLVLADNHCNNPWMEVAVIDEERGVQIESITMGWIDELQRKVDYLVGCETTDSVMRKVGDIPIDGAGEDEKAWFTCGCCGEDFQSTIAKQKRYDQDNGYGICSGCKRYYGG